MWYIDVNVKGAAAKIDQIKKFDKELWKNVQKDVKDAAKLVVDEAKANVPSYGLYNRERGIVSWGAWTSVPRGRDLSFDSATVAGSIKPGFRSKSVGGMRIVKGRAQIWNPGGAIYTLAGSRNRTGHPFNTNINNQAGGYPGKAAFWPRILTPAWYEKGPEAAKRIGKTIEDAIEKANR